MRAGNPTISGETKTQVQAACQPPQPHRRNTANKYHWHVWECSQCLGRTESAAAHGKCAFPVYTSEALGSSAGELSEAGPGLRALPRSEPLRFRFLGTPQRSGISWACSVCPSRAERLG